MLSAMLVYCNILIRY